MFLMTVTCSMNKADVCVLSVWSPFSQLENTFCAVSARWIWNRLWIQDFQILFWKKAPFQNGLLNKCSAGCYEIFLLLSCFYRNLFIYVQKYIYSEFFCLGTIWSNWSLWDPSGCIPLLDKNSSICFLDLGITVIQRVSGSLRKNPLKIMQHAALQVLWAFSFTCREKKSFRDWVGGVSFLPPKLVSLWEDLKQQNRDYEARLDLLESCMSTCGPTGILEISYCPLYPLTLSSPVF